jgi:amidase
MRITREDPHIHHLFSPANQPILEIQPDQTLTVETRDASNGQLRPNRQEPIDRETLLPLTGPLAVSGALPGDVISVAIESIRFAEKGHAWIRSGLGIRSAKFDGLFYVWEFDVSETITLPGGAVIPLRPMVGIMGVCPDKVTPARLPGVYGGNLDCTDIAPGNTLWLPVFVPGANLSVGDVHAAMGDGEVGGTGVEIDAEVDFTVRLHKGLQLNGPIVTTPNKVIFLASARHVEIAAAVAFENAVRSLVERQGLSDKEAHLAASIAGNMKICQLVNGDVTVGFELPSAVLKW